MTETSRAVSAAGPAGAYGLRNLARFSRDQLRFLRELADEYGDVVEMRVFGAPWFVLNHPAEIEEVFVKQNKAMGRDGYIVILRRALGMGLLTNEGESWKRQRKLMAGAFTPKRIASYGDTMVEVTKRELGSWRGGETLSLHDEMSRITMEIVAAVLFGTSVGPEGVDVVRHSMEVLNEYFANSPEAMLKLPAWVPTPLNRRVSRAVADLDALVFEIIAERRQSGELRNDLLGTLLAAQDDDGSGMTDQQLRDEAITLFLAGHETTALLLAHTFYFLSKQPGVERQLRAEIEQVLEGRTPTAADVSRLPYAERVLKESMRLLPPAWTTGREALEDVDINGVHIPKGAQILISQWVVQRDPRFFPNPEGFDPDRWLPERAKSIPRYAYFPFGGGPRVCIGNHFALMEATLVMAAIMQRFHVELLPGQRLELKPSVTLRQKRALKILIRDAEQPTRATTGLVSASTRGSRGW